MSRDISSLKRQLDLAHPQMAEKPVKRKGNGGSSEGTEPPMTDYVTHAEFQDAVHGLKSDVAEVRSDIHKGIVETQRWMFATVIGLFVGFGGLFLAMSNALKPAPAHAPQQQAPIIINVPGTAPAPAPAQAPPAR